MPARTDITGLANSCTTAFNNIGTSPVQIATPSPTRQKITFDNPGTVDIVVFPLTAFIGLPSGTNNASQTLTPSVGALGGGFRVYANGGDVVREGQVCKQGFQCLAVSGSGNPFTVTEES